MNLVFDIDGTLTDPRQPMNSEFKEWFKLFVLKHEVFLATGSDYPKILEQVGADVAELVNGVWACCGNELWIRGQLVNKNAWKPSTALIKFLIEEIDKSIYHKYGNHIEVRTGMVNFSPCGRNATATERHCYKTWDTFNQQRLEVSYRIKEAFPKLDMSIGGDISIDIYPKGNDKGQIYSYFSEGFDPILFADKILPGGVDYPLAKLLDNVYNIENGYKETWRILKEIG